MIDLWDKLLAAEVAAEFEETLSSSSSTWWSIRVSAPQLSIKLLETVNARGPSFDEFPSVVDCGGIPVATVGRLTSEIVVATVGRLTTGRRDATVGRLISATSLVATVGRLTTKRVSAATVGRLTTGRRDATVGRLISATISVFEFQLFLLEIIWLQHKPEVVASVVDCRGIPVATVGRLTSGIVVTTVGRLTTGRRDATGGRLISATSLVATVGRLTTKRV